MRADLLPLLGLGGLLFAWSLVFWGLGAGRAAAGVAAVAAVICVLMVFCFWPTTPRG